MVIQYYVKHVYGNPLMYIIDKQISEVITGLTNKKTIDQGIIENMTKLGHSFEQVLPPTQ